MNAFLCNNKLDLKISPDAIIVMLRVDLSRNIARFKNNETVIRRAIAEFANDLYLDIDTAKTFIDIKWLNEELARLRKQMQNNT